MYQVSNSFLQAMDDVSRTLAVHATIAGVDYPATSIIDFELERGGFDNDIFTIGQTMASALTLNVFTNSTISAGDEVVLSIDLLVDGDYTRVPLGVYYVDTISTNQEKMTLTCYDKMVALDGEYIPSGAFTTLAQLISDIENQTGIEFNPPWTDVAIKAPLKGYSYRDTLGFIASLNGGNMIINRDGQFEIRTYATVDRTIPAQAQFSLSVKDVYTVSNVQCLFGDVGIQRGDDSGHSLVFENPYVTEDHIDLIYNKLKGLQFAAGTVSYRGDVVLDPGDVFTLEDYKNERYTLLCARNTLTFNGGLSGKLESVGESEATNKYTELKFKNKKDLTSLTIELGKIQAIVQGIEQSHDGLEERMNTAEQKITDQAIINTVKKEVYTKSETENAITSKGYQTSSQVQQTVNNLEIKFGESGGYNLIRNGGFENGFAYWLINGGASANVNQPWQNYDGVSAFITSPVKFAGIFQGFVTKVGRTYSYSAYVQGEASTHIVGIENIHVREVYATPNQWHYISGTFVATSTWTTFICYNNVDSEGKIFIDNVCVCEGSVPHKYSPHPNELYEGITKIDKDGITITHSNSDLKTQYTNDGMLISNSSGGRVLQVNREGVHAEGGKFIVTDSNNGYTRLWGRDIEINGQRALVGTGADPDGLVAHTLYVNYTYDFVNGVRIMGPAHVHGPLYHDNHPVTTNRGVSKNTSGYCVQEPGIWTQWGKVNLLIYDGWAEARVTFPTLFANVCTHVSVNIMSVDGGVGLLTHYIAHATYIDRSGFTIHMKNIDGRNFGSSADLTFFAVGY